MKNLVEIAKLSIAAAGILSVISMSTLAEDLPTRGPIPFSAYDKNQDGLISKSEFDLVNAERASAKKTQGLPLLHADDVPDFSKFDTDKDKKLSETEFLNSCSRCHKDQPMHMQKNATKMGDMQDMSSNLRSFGSYDLNNDGFLTTDEMAEARAKSMQLKASLVKMLRHNANQSKLSEISANAPKCSIDWE